MKNTVTEKQFVPRWDRSDKCPACGELGMCQWQPTSTGRRCANCGHIEDRQTTEEVAAIFDPMSRDGL